MTDRAAEIAEQTRIRHALLANGYTPLANNDKRCMLPGWSTLDVDEGLIDTWADAYKYRATGVRIENGLVMIDFDIDDDDLIEQIVDTIPDDLWTAFSQCPVRQGKGAKEAWFARIDKPFLRWASAAFLRPGDEAVEDAPLHRLEVFGGASSRQAGAYGAHSIAGGGSVAVEYRWPGLDLLLVPLVKLPLITEAQVTALCAHVNAVLEKAGWLYQSKIAAGETVTYEVFDLTDDMEFDTGQELLTYHELAGECQGGSVRVSASWLEGPQARNPTRCIASLRHDGSLQILETASYQLHRPVKVEQFTPDLAARFEALRAKAAGGGSMFKATPISPEGEKAAVDLGDIDDAVLAHLLAEYAACPADARTPIYPLDGSTPLTMTNFKLRFAPFKIITVGAKGGITETNPVTLWVAHPDRIEIVGAAYRPDSAERLVGDADTGGLVLNNYRPPEHDAPGADAAGHLRLWRAFLDHLVPNPVERAWLVNKIAGKAQRPELPGVVTLLVAPQQGTGRGSLFMLLEGLFGRRNCITLDRNKLFGRDGQGQYTDWRAGRLLGFVHELLAGEGGGGFQHRRLEMYEHLKVVGDPAAMTFDVVEKYKGTRDAVAHISLFIATNHMNALPIQAGDRRIAVISGGKVKLDDVPMLQAIHDVKDDAAFLAAVWADLLSVVVDWDQIMRAPQTDGREAMIEENSSDLDTLIAEVLEKVPGDFITIGALRDRVRRKLIAAGMEDEPKWQSRMSNMLSLHDNACGWVYSRHRYKVAKEGAENLSEDYLFMQIVARGSRGHSWFAGTPLRGRRDALRAENPNTELGAALLRAREKGIDLVK